MSNVQRQPHDPPSAELAHVWCPSCASGGKPDAETYYDGSGRIVLKSSRVCVCGHDRDDHVDGVGACRHDIGRGGQFQDCGCSRMEGR
jgi:hypothetical protein